MKRHDMQKPLVQSALVLLAVFLLIGLVAGSEANSIAAGITSMFKGIFLTILFVVALVIAVIISIALLVGIYLAALALYSPQAAGEGYHKLRIYLKDYASSWSASLQKRMARSRATPSSSTARDTRPSSTVHVDDKTKTSDAAEDAGGHLSQEISKIDSSLSQLQEENRNISAAVSKLETTINEMPVEEVSTTTEKLTVRQEEMSAGLADCQSRLDEMSSTLQQNANAMDQQKKQLQEALEKIEVLTSELEGLRSLKEPTEELSQNPQEEPRLFAYIEEQQYRKQIGELVDEALAEDMTYAEIDDFLSQSLPQEIDTILKEHPSLTKDFIRNRKNS